MNTFGMAANLLRSTGAAPDAPVTKWSPVELDRWNQTALALREAFWIGRGEGLARGRGEPLPPMRQGLYHPPPDRA